MTRMERLRVLGIGAGSERAVRACQQAARLSESLNAAPARASGPVERIEDQLARFADPSGMTRRSADRKSRQHACAGPDAIRISVERALGEGRRLKAFVEVFDDRALELAGGLRGAEDSLLSGLPFAFKDVYSCQYRVPQAGSGHDFRGLATTHSDVIAVLEGAGAVAVGATNLDPWCYSTTGINLVAGSPVHPDDPDLVVGGSSAGSAVAVAAGIVPFALGTDTGGSVRIPAALCGVFGFKPTNGLISTQGVVPLSRSHDCIGILARSPALIRDVIGTLAPGEMPSSQGHDVAPAIGICQDAFEQCEGPIRLALKALLGSVTASSAITARSVLPDLDLCNDVASIITAFEGFAALRGAAENNIDAFPEHILDRLAGGAVTDETTYQRAQEFRGHMLPEVLEGLFAEADFVLVPVTRSFAPRHSQMSGGGRDAAVRMNLDLLHFNRWVNLFGLPSLTVPVIGFAGPNVTGIQLVGKPHSDSLLLEAAETLMPR